MDSNREIEEDGIPGNIPFKEPEIQGNVENLAEELRKSDINFDENENVTEFDSQSKMPPEGASKEDTGGAEDETDNQDGLFSSLRGAKNKNKNHEIIMDENRNKRALAADEPTYKLEEFEKNAIVIFNHYKVHGHKPRVGTFTDGERLARTLMKFSFKVNEHFDLTKQQIFDELEKFSSKDFTDYGCVVIAVMTHGGEKGTLMAKDLPYNELDILRYFKHLNKPTLFTKPVIVIIQACRGYEDMKGAEIGLRFQAATYRDNVHENDIHYHLPVEADTVVLHSSYIGKASHRESEGTWFIQTLCSKIESLWATHDLLSIMTEVQRDVAIKNEHLVMNRVTGEYQINKQMPVVTSALWRKLYFRKYGDVPPVLEHGTASSDNILRHGEDTIEYSHKHILNQCKYMREILKVYVSSRQTQNLEARHLLKQADFNENSDINTMQTTLIAMSNFLKNKFNGSVYNKFIYYYEME